MKSGIEISTKCNIEFYDTMINQLNNAAYGKLSGIINYKSNLIDNKDVFENLSVYDQAHVLIEIVKFLKGNKGQSDLRKINCGGRSGALTFNKNIINHKVEIINQSPCGLHTTIRKV